MQDRQAWHVGEGRRNEVEILPDPHHVGVRIVARQDRILVAAVAEVGAPRRPGGRIRCGKSRYQEERVHFVRTLVANGPILTTSGSRRSILRPPIVTLSSRTSSTPRCAS